MYCNLTMRRDKSFADDLIAHRGVVSGRVALLLRSAETKPLMPRFVPFGISQSYDRPQCVYETWKYYNILVKASTSRSQDWYLAEFFISVQLPFFSCFLLLECQVG
jgi:hypothetical protein